MKKVLAKIDLMVSSQDWNKFIHTRLHYADQFGSSEITYSMGKLSIRRLSPIPRPQLLEIFFNREDDGVYVDFAEVVSLDDSAIPFTSKEIKSDVVNMINDAISGD